MPKRKANRCRIKSCNIVIREGYTFCYMHRYSAFTTNVAPPSSELNLRRFYCDGCGQSFRSLIVATDCRFCGGKLEEVSDN